MNTLTERYLQTPLNAGIQHRVTPTLSVKENRANPFVTAATPLLTLMTQIKRAESCPDVQKLRTQIVNEVKLFEQKLLKLNHNPKMVLAARYCLCTALDEAVMGTAWGTQSSWVQQSLLSLFHKETWGGERFYIILENIVKEPRKNLDIIELLYLMLSLGFEGKFFEQNQMVQAELRSRIFQRIRQSRGKVAKALSSHWQDSKPLEATHQKRTLLRRLLFGTAGILVAINLLFNYQVHEAAVPTVQQLAKIGRESPVTVYSQLIDRTLLPKSFH